MMYKQLTEKQRLQIWTLRKERKSQSKIAELLNIHRSTVGRELARNSGPYGYDPRLAQQLAATRKQLHNQVIAIQYQELLGKLQQMGINKAQRQQFIVHFHPELSLEQVDGLLQDCD